MPLPLTKNPPGAPGIQYQICLFPDKAAVQLRLPGPMFWLFFFLDFLCSTGHAGAALQPQPTPEEAYGEAYTAVASLDDGSFVFTQ